MQNTGYFLKTKIFWAVVMSLLASLSYAIMLSCVKFSLDGFTTNQIAFIRSVVSLILVFCCILYCKKKDSVWTFLKTKAWQIHLIRSVTAILTIYSFFFALKTLSTAEASLLLNTAPIFIPLVSFFWKKTSLDIRVWPGIACAFIGVFCLLHPESGSCNYGLWIALVGAIVCAISVVALRSAHYSEPICRIVFYYALLSTVLSGVLCLVEASSWQSLWNAKALYGVLAVGVTGFLYQMLFALSIKYAPVKIIGPFSYVSVIFSLILDFILWDSRLLGIEVLGMCFVFMGLYLMVFLLRNEEKPAKQSS
jgi:drug/metabolite transporter (DMT)-like permease